MALLALSARAIRWPGPPEGQAGPPLTFEFRRDLAGGATARRVLSVAPMASDRVRRSWAPLVITRGDRYAARGAVTIASGDGTRVSAVVRGALSYDVTLRYAAGGQHEPALITSCTCAHAAIALCKHAWAALRVADERGLLCRAAAHEGELRALPAMPERHGDEVRWVIDLARGPRTGPRPCVEAFERTTGARGLSTGWRAAPAGRAFERAAVLEGSASALAALARGGRCEVFVEREGPARRLVVDDGGPFRFGVVVTEGRVQPGAASTAFPSLLVRGQLRRANEVLPLDTLTAAFDDGLAFVGPRAITLEPEAPLEWLEALSWRREVAIAPEDAPTFLRDLFATCEERAVDLPGSLSIERRLPLQTRVDLRREGACGASLEEPPLAAALSFAYGGASARRPEPGGVIVQVAPLRLVARDHAAEQRAIAELLRVGFAELEPPREGHDLSLAAGRLSEAVLALPGEGFVVAVDGVTHRRLRAASIAVTSCLLTFDVEVRVAFEGASPSAAALGEAARRSDGRVALEDGSVGLLPEEWVARLSRLMALSERGERGDNGEQGGKPRVERQAPPQQHARQGLVLRFARAQLLLVDRVLGAVDWDVPLAALRAQLARAPSELTPAPVPRSFTGTMAGHQRAGLSWLQWLEGVGMSGCLADDASLGTTVQVLALVLDRKERGRAEAPSLVVTPSSRLAEWLAEARDRAPSLRIAELSRATTPREARSADLLLTTSAALRELTDALAGLVLDYLVVDAKSASAAAHAASTRTVRRLGSRHRLALSGGPVEPHLGAMLALFDFLNPGMLGSPRLGPAALARRHEPEKDEARLLWLALRPLILRRSKGDLLAAHAPSMWGVAPHVGRPDWTAAPEHVPQLATNT